MVGSHGTFFFLLLLGYVKGFAFFHTPRWSIASRPFQSATTVARLASEGQGETYDVVNDDVEDLRRRAAVLRKEAAALESAKSLRARQLSVSAPRVPISFLRKPKPVEALQGDLNGSLDGTKWRLSLTIERLPGTWMPPAWGASGNQLLVDVAVHFLPGGIVQAGSVSPPWVQCTFAQGKWKVAGRYPNSTCRFSLTTSGWRRGDVELPEGNIFFSVPAFGGILSRKKGTVTVRQKRWFVREESRIIGTFATTKLDDEIEAAGTAAGAAKG